MHALTQTQTRAIRSIVRHQTAYCPASLPRLTYSPDTHTLTAMSDITILQLYDITPANLPHTPTEQIKRLTESNTRYDSYVTTLPVQQLLRAASGHERTGATVDNTVTLAAPTPAVPPVYINAYRVRDVLRALRCTSADSIECTVYYRRDTRAPYSQIAYCITVSIPAGRALIMCVRPSAQQKKEEN